MRRIAKALPFVLAAIGFSAVVVWSIVTGSASVSLTDFLTGRATPGEVHTLVASRLPRTFALVLSGAALAVSGVILQVAVRNRFVEPSTTGTAESAALGLLLAAVIAPQAPVMVRVVFAIVLAMAGTGLYLAILSRIPLRDATLPPLVGMVFSGVIGAIAATLATRWDLLPSLGAWTVGSFSGVIEGRWETLLIAGICLAFAYLYADRLTIVGLGEGVASSLGLDYRRTLTGAMAAISLVSAVVVSTVGMLPFLGLVVPNIVSRFSGDRLRSSLPWVGLTGASFLLVCDVFARIVVAPSEIPIGVVVGVVGAGIFLLMLLKSEEAK